MGGDQKTEERVRKNKCVIDDNIKTCHYGDVMLTDNPILVSADDKLLLRNYVYSTPQEILRELKRRNEDKRLKKKVNVFLENTPLSALGSNKPRAVLTRSIFTPNKEFAKFIKETKEFGLAPILFEYDNKFVAKNLEKYHLCKLHSFTDRGKRGGINFTTKK